MPLQHIVRKKATVNATKEEKKHYAYLLSSGNINMHECGIGSAMTACHFKALLLMQFPKRCAAGVVVVRGEHENSNAQSVGD